MPKAITALLIDWANGDQRALDDLTPLVYQELKWRAAAYLEREKLGHTLQATALVNEAYLRLIDQTHQQWQNRSHFFAIASQLMRQILVDHARSKNAMKRGCGAERVSLHDAMSVCLGVTDSLLALDEALSALEASDPRKAKVIELRYFGGLTVDEIAQLLGTSVATVGRESRMAEAWLRRRIGPTRGHET
jgi:RNA polymerase sigma-70 factor (ECF subfamily)